MNETNIDISKFKIIKSNNPLDKNLLEEIKKAPQFGKKFTDHMSHIHFSANPGLDDHEGVSTKNGNWHSHEVIPYQNLSLEPAAAVFHYGQEIFEGIKAYAWEDGTIHTFRPQMNAERFNRSALRLGLPDLPTQDFISSIAALVKLDAHWVPAGQGQALYLRPFMIASEAFLGVRPAHEVDYYCIASPVGAYFGVGKPVSIWVEREFHRAGPGGTGEAKCGGNYAASQLPALAAFEKGCSQVLYLDARDEESIEELGGMSFFVVKKDGSVVTPSLNGNILHSVTRRSIIELLADRGISVEERRLTLTEVVEGVKSGEITEAFACGTAAVVTPIGKLVSNDFDIAVSGGEEEGKLTASIREEIVGIQTGKIEDKFNWMIKLT